MNRIQQRCEHLASGIHVGRSNPIARCIEHCPSLEPPSVDTRDRADRKVAVITQSQQLSLQQHLEIAPDILDCSEEDLEGELQPLMMAQAVPNNPPSDKKRVKVYELRNNDWFDRGTGFCTAAFIFVCCLPLIDLLLLGELFRLSTGVERLSLELFR